MTGSETVTAITKRRGTHGATILFFNRIGMPGPAAASWWADSDGCFQLFRGAQGGA